jgi:hypothetical protein
VKKTTEPNPVPADVPDAGALQQEIARLFAAVEQHTETLAELEASDNFDENPDVDGIREDKEVCLREIIRLDRGNIDAHVGLVEMFLDVGEVLEEDLDALERLNAAKPRRTVTTLIKNARATLAEADDEEELDDE